MLGDRALSVTADSASYPERHREMALSIARQFALHHEIIHTAELERPEYRANNPDRCYHCKHELFTELTRWPASAASPPSPTATTPTTAATTVPAAAPRASSASSARSTRPG